MQDQSERERGGDKMMPGPGRAYPVATFTLLALNGLAFLFELSLGAQLEPFVRRWGTVPSDVRAVVLGTDASPAAAVTVLTAMFLHAGWVHLATNVLYLWVFGARVEKGLGSVAFVCLYFAAGIAAALSQIAAAPDLAVPAVGASGAVAGVLGAYLALYPGATLATLAPRFFYGRARDLPAAALLGLWLASQLLNGALAITDAGTEAGRVQAVGWWAHGGGFAAGLALGSLAAGRFRWVRRAVPRPGGPAPAGGEPDLPMGREAPRQWKE